MDAESIRAGGELLIGPAAALVVLALMLAGTYWALVKHILPFAMGYLARQEARWDKALESHAEDRETYREAVTALTDGQSRIVIRVRSMEDKVDVIEKKVDSLVA